MNQQPAPKQRRRGRRQQTSAASPAHPLQALERMVAQAGPAHTWTDMKEHDKKKKEKKVIKGGK